MSSGTAHDVPSISLSDLLEAVSRRGVTLVDVLSPESYAAVHIDGAISLPVAEIALRARQLIPDRARPIVVYCGGPT